MYNKTEKLLKIDDLFFKIDLSFSVVLLSFLGIPDDKIKEIYFQLISFKELRVFKKNDIIYMRGMIIYLTFFVSHNFI